MTPKEKLQIIHHWSQKFDLEEIDGAFSGLIHSSGKLSKQGIMMSGTYRVDCLTKEEVIDSTYRVLREHVWCKVCKICRN